MGSPISGRNRILVTRLFALALISLQLVSVPKLGENTLLRQLMIWSGYVLVVTGVMGRVYSSLFISGRKNEELVCSGPYSVVRNPLYVCSFVATLGIGLESGTLTMVALLAGAFIVYYPMVVRSEERQLAKILGPAYEEYRTEVPCWLPAFRRWSEPTELTVRTRFLRRTLLDAAVFFVPLPCYFLINRLHAIHLLPRWLIIP
ncbi:MAG: sodium:proton antiporter [Pirellulaceae bacterium]|nr:MAG: sodium:proton antiporter [Pirellulaceae bacterium]